MALSEYGKVVSEPANKYTRKHGVFKWTSTNATGNLPTNGLKTIFGASFVPLGAYAVADGIRIVETPDADGSINVGSDGVIAIARDTGGTSAQYVLYTLYGY